MNNYCQVLDYQLQLNSSATEIVTFLDHNEHSKLPSAKKLRFNYDFCSSCIHCCAAISIFITTFV